MGLRTFHWAAAGGRRWKRSLIVPVPTGHNLTPWLLTALLPSLHREALEQEARGLLEQRTLGVHLCEAS